MNFKLTILNPEKTIYEGEATSVFLQGDKGDFELLPYHSPAISILEESDILIDGKKTLSISKGIAQFYNNECLILAEEKKVTEGS
ncbi:MAG: F0F1 ATP synthase subunit epsilon [Candidatus Omnitrophica bacterium]|nr:F0F1 ATP synthase subunit epsilon [Candidatus Omnitrophota bacterium]